jgi:hemerythrin superfamily protein
MTNAVPEPDDVVALIRHQHELVRQSIGMIKAAAPDERAGLFQELAMTVPGHETAEQSVVYPALRELGAEGERVADARIAEEEQASETLAGLESLDASTAQFEQAFTAFSGDVEQHALSEEAEVLPLLQRFEAARRLEMAEAFRSVQMEARA